MWYRRFRSADAKGTGLQDRIRQMLVSAILDGQLPAGESIPSGRKLADELGVARNTVMLAYQQLADEGYLVARERSGYYVNPEIRGPRVSLRARREAPQDPAPQWAKRLRFRPSEQRNIVKPSDWQAFRYPFIYGQSDPSLFPTHEWRECCMKLLTVMELRDWAPDQIARDDTSLVQEIQSKVLPRRGVWATADEILVTVGAQHALYLLADLLVSPETTVGVEDPGYPDARNTFASRTKKLVALPVDAEGIAASKSLEACDYVYVTPSHQCPTTVTMALERRETLLELAAKRDFILIEDDYESEAGFESMPTPALKSLDREERVIYVGSLSKAFAPGLRLGYIVGSKTLIGELRALRRLMLRHPSAFIQRSFALFMSLGHYDALLRRRWTAYRERMEVLQTALQKHVPEVSYVPVSGGASCWVSGPEWLDARELAGAAAKRGVLIEPGDVFFISGSPRQQHLRLGITSIGADRIGEGIRELGNAIRGLAPCGYRAEPKANIRP
jgi:GntR family transcriptional regulator/MocR family aminotransferase